MEGLELSIPLKFAEGCSKEDYARSEKCRDWGEGGLIFVPSIVELLGVSVR